MMPGIVEFSRDPDFLARDSRIHDALADFVLVAVGQRGVDVAVPGLESSGDGMADFLLIAGEVSGACGGGVKAGDLYLTLGGLCQVPRPTAGILAPCNISLTFAYHVE